MGLCGEKADQSLLHNALFQQPAIGLHLFSFHPESTAKTPTEIRSKYAKKAENNAEDPPENANKGRNYVLD